MYKLELIQKKKHTAFYFCIFMLFLISMNLWIGWDGRSLFFNSFFSIAIIFFIIVDNIRLNWSLQNFLPLICILISYFYIYGTGTRILGLFSVIVPYTMIILLNEKDRINCLDYIVKWFAILMIPSIITYVLVHTVGIPSLGKIWYTHTPYYDISYKLRVNYLFYVFSDFYGIRFNGPFVEAGHLGMMLAFLLFATRYNIKKAGTWILLLALLLTLSLSGYVLAFVGYIFVMFDRGKISLKNTILFMLVLLFVYLFSTYYNAGDNFLNEYIFSRLGYDEEKGFVGNNRVFGEIDLYYVAMFDQPDILLHGYGADTMEWLAYNNSRGTGYVYWMVSHGIIGTVLAMLFYFVYTLCSKNKRYAILALLFVFLLFWQRSYSFWFSWVICFVYGISYSKRIKYNF